MYPSSQPSYDDIEIRIHANAYMSSGVSSGDDRVALNEAGYLVKLRNADGEAKSERPPLPYEEFERLASNPRDYGARLFDWLFEGEVGTAFRQALWGAESMSQQIAMGGLRVRLWLDDKAPRLQTLRWEAMFDPSRAEPLSLSIPFSRFVRVRAPRGQENYERPLRVLLIAANVKGEPDFDLAAVDDVLTRLASSGESSTLRQLLTLEKLVGRPSLAQLEESLKKAYHVIQLWAHAENEAGKSQLIFSDDTGEPQRVSFDAALKLIEKNPPHLVFLITNADKNEKAAVIQDGLGPRLLEIGVQAVVAVQSAMRTDELAQFTEQFYAVLFRTGLIDVAVAEARNKIYQPERWDWARPTLYVRTQEAQLFQPLPDFLESIVQSRAIKEVFNSYDQ